MYDYRVARSQEWNACVLKGNFRRTTMQEKQNAADSGLRVDSTYAGCTAIAALLYGTTLVVANSGDCRYACIRFCIFLAVRLESQQ